MMHYKKVSTVVFFTLIISVSAWAQALIYGPQVEEVNYSYQATFINEGTRSQAMDLATDHASHMSSLLKAPELTEKLGVDYNKTEGFGAPRADSKIKVLSTKKLADGKIEISYSNSGTMILHRTAAEKILQNEFIVLPLPDDVSKIFNKKCTDEDYDTLGDYWYFYDPFRTGCTYLLKEPYAKNVKINITKNPEQFHPMDLNLDTFRGDNGNGKLFSIYVIHGFEESSTSRKDLGRQNFNELNKLLLSEGYEETIDRKTKTRPLYSYTKSLKLADGNEVDVEIKHLLVETGIESRGVTFAKFFKEAVENADVIVYEGHSGLGGNLDIPSLEDKAGGFKFKPKKHQIFFFDSCSSYSYYLDMFVAKKPRGTTEVITNGLESGFDVSTDILGGLLDSLLDERVDSVSWDEILKRMEKPLDGGSYLLNVGG